MPCVLEDLEKIMTPNALKTLIESDATAAALLASGNDSGCADRCTAIAPTIRRPILAIDAKREAALSGAWAALVLASRESSAAPNQIKGLAITFIDWVNTAAAIGGQIDLDLPVVQQMAGVLIAAGVVTQQQFAAIAALANTTQIVTPLDVEFVRTRI